MIDTDLRARLEQLFADGSIEQSDVADSKSTLLAALDNLGISYNITGRRLAIDSAQALIKLDSIQLALAQITPPGDFEWQYRLLTESTNADALELFESSGKHCITLAEMQTAGRGRRGRQWVSPFAKNIICSIGMSKSVNACNPGLLSIVTGLALVEALFCTGIAGVKLKWPNDLYYQNQKLGGILIESKLITGSDYFFAIGFGINVMMNAADLRDIPQPVTSLDLITDSPVSRDTLLIEAIRQVVKAVTDFDQSSVLRIVDRFNAVDAFQNQAICVNYGAESIDGLNLGINDEGQLKLQTEQGVQVFSAADISLRGSI